MRLYNGIIVDKKLKKVRLCLIIFIIVIFSMPVYAHGPEVVFTISGLEEVTAQEEVVFDINAQILDESEVLGDDVPLRYKAVLTMDGELSVSQKVYYGENYEFYFVTDDTGTAYCGPSTGFTLEQLPELKNEDGITTTFKATFELPGSYILYLYLLDISDDDEGVIDQPGIFPFVVIDGDVEEPQPQVHFSFSGFENLEAGEIFFEINGRVEDNEAIGEDVPLEYRITLTRNGVPLVNQEIFYGSDYSNSFVTDGHGTANFKPQEEFSLKSTSELTSEDGLTTTFLTELHQGNYILIVYLVDASDEEYITPLGQAGAQGFSVFYAPQPPLEVVVKAKFPDAGDMYDEHSLYSKVIDGTRRYFIRITFEDADEGLFFSEFNGLNNMRTSRLFPTGSAHANLLDLDFLNYLTSLEWEERLAYINEYIFNKSTSAGEAYLYIPIRLLHPGTSYDVIINPNIVLVERDGIQSGNAMVMWSFNTMSIPYITGISPGSVVEGYDTQKPIIIKGGFFTDNVNVYFTIGEDSYNAIGAYRVSVGHHEGANYLEVLLPRGSNRLKAGMYNVIVENSINHEQLYHGVFSVLPEGHHIPNADYRVKNEIRQGDILSSIRTSEDTLVLSTRFRDTSTLELNLDELMGEEVLVRKVEFEGRSGDRIGELITRSRWADVTVFGLSAISSSRNEKATISLGRVEPFFAQSIKTSLWNNILKSDLIQVTCDNSRFERIRVSIPFTNSSGDNLKVLRYDEITRRWSNVDSYTINLIDRRVVLQSFSPGIFVVVE